MPLFALRKRQQNLRFRRVASNLFFLILKGFSQLAPRKKTFIQRYKALQFVFPLGLIHRLADADSELQYPLSIIGEILPSLVTEAQRSLVGGKIKLSWVIDQVYQRLPDAIKTHIPSWNVKEMIENALAVMKVLWAEKPEILKNENIEVEVEELEGPPLRVIALKDLKAGDMADLQFGLAVLMEPEPGGAGAQDMNALTDAVCEAVCEAVADTINGAEGEPDMGTHIDAGTA